MANYGLSRLDGLFNNLFDEFLMDSTNAQSKVTNWKPRLDIVKSDDHYTVKAELPGVDIKDITLTVKNNTLYISGSKETEREIRDDNSKYISREIYSGSFSRSISLGDYADTDNISAKMVNGVLNITIPKKDPPKSIEIAIE